MIKTILKKIDARQYIFCINTGRAGSEYLAHLFDSAKGVAAFHEPRPYMTGDVLKWVTEDSYENTYSKRIYKADAIKKALKEEGKKIYAETNHMFIKTFFDIAVNELNNVKIVHLKRNVLDVLISFCELGYFSERNTAWKDWMVSPYARTAAVPCLIPEEKQDHIGLIIAYLIDIYARAERFKKDYPDVPVYEVHLSQLNDINEVDKMFDWLGTSMTDKTKELIGKKQNDRALRKKELGGYSQNKEYLRQRLIQYVNLLQEKGVNLPLANY